MDTISEEDQDEVMSRERTKSRRSSLPWERFYFQKKAYKSSDKGSPLLGSRSRRIGKPTMSAPPGLTTHNSDTLKVDDADSGSRPPLKSRKISLSCLVSSVLSFERGRRRASRAREDELLQSAEGGDLIKVRKLVLQDGVVNINCTDPLGRTPLHLAVANEQKEVVNFLLGHVDKKCVYQALMLAINLGHDEIAEMIIEHPMYGQISTEIKTHGQAQFFMNTFGDDNQFSEEITPLILAAQQNRFEIVMALLMKNEEIQQPHKYLCACTDCERMIKCDELKFAKARLNAYKGLSSEAYISLSSEDPVLTSFELRKELLQVAADEKYYTAEYTILSDQLSDYVVRLLDKVHGNEELNAILNAYDATTTDEGEITLPRLQLAIEYKEKKTDVLLYKGDVIILTSKGGIPSAIRRNLFVAHPSCQKKLTTMWYADFNALLKSRSVAFKVAFVTCITLLYPFLAAWYIVWPRSKSGDILRTPVVKFVAQAVSFVFFLGLILTHSYVEQKKLCSTKFLDDKDISKHWAVYKNKLNTSSTFIYLGKMCIRNHTPGFLEVLVMIWITGLLWQECKQVYQGGFRAHFMDVYNHVDFFMLKFYIASITLRQLQHLMVYSAIDYFRHKASWEKLVVGSEEALYKLYFLNADRYYWDPWDPYHMCEALFAVANILNFTRLFYLLAISEHLGPMLITLERMLKDMTKFMVTYIGILSAFIVGLYNLYWYYDPLVRGKVEVVDHHINTRAELAFGSLELTFRSVFWALFGLKDSRLVEIQDRKVEGRGFSTRLTESVGYIIFGVYHWAAVIILLNMLIAMMTRSFEKIAIHQDIEWKFARSKLYMEYIEEGSTLPVPFNLIPSVKTFIRALGVCVIHCTFRNPCRKKKSGKEQLIRMSVNNSNSLFTSKNGDVEGNTEGHCETTYVISNNSESVKQSSPKSSHSSSPARSPVFAPKSMNWGFSNSKASDNDYKTVIKRVVRRYIFEHLQATVGSEASNELQGIEAMKQEFHTVHCEINTLKPKVQSEFDRVRSEMVEYRTDMKNMQKSMEIMQDQLKTIVDLFRPSATTSANCSLQSSTQTIHTDCKPHSPVNNIQDEDILTPMYTNLPSYSESKATGQYHPTYLPISTTSDEQNYHHEKLLPRYSSPGATSYYKNEDIPSDSLRKRRLSNSDLPSLSSSSVENSTYLTNNDRSSKSHSADIAALPLEHISTNVSLLPQSDSNKTDSSNNRHVPLQRSPQHHQSTMPVFPGECSNNQNEFVIKSMDSSSSGTALTTPQPFKQRSSSARMRHKNPWNNPEDVNLENKTVSSLGSGWVKDDEEVDVYEYSL